MDFDDSPLKGDDNDDSSSDLGAAASDTGLTPALRRLSTTTPARRRDNKLDGGASAMHTDGENGDLPNKCRQLARKMLSKRLHVNAAYFADKLVTLTNGRGEDVLLLAQAYHQGRDYRRAVQVLERHGLLATTRDASLMNDACVPHLTPLAIEAAFLAAQCFASSDKYDECIQQLESIMPWGEDEDFAAVREELEHQMQTLDRHESGDIIATVAAMCSLRGRVYEIQDNRSRAIVWLKNALKLDVHHVEAMDFLTDRRLLGYEEEVRLLSGELRFDKGDDWLRALYSTRLCLQDPEHSLPSKFEAVEKAFSLGENPSVVAARAEAAYAQYDSHTAYELAKQVYDMDPFNQSCLPVYASAMVDLGLKTELYHTAHKLVETHSKNAASWYAVGCYYMCVRKAESAQKYFHKATKLDPRFVPAWIGFGNAFAAQDESDQAMAAYRTASRLMPSSHQPLLYIGMEYLRTNNLSLAYNFLRTASELCSTDPLLHHEMGCALFKMNKPLEAARSFQKTFRLCQAFKTHNMAKWEDTILNLGHCYRKCENYSEAIKYYQMAIGVSPRNASAYAALAFTYHLQDDLDLAVEYYHRALGLRGNDSFATDMLAKALEDVVHRGESPVTDLVPSFMKQPGGGSGHGMEQEEDVIEVRGNGRYGIGGS